MKFFSTWILKTVFWVVLGLKFTAHFIFSDCIWARLNPHGMDHSGMNEAPIRPQLEARVALFNHLNFISAPHLRHLSSYSHSNSQNYTSQLEI